MSEQVELTGTQALWDVTFQKLGRSCPAQRADESGLDYQRRLARVGRKYIPKGERIAQVKFDHTLPDAVVGQYSELMRQCVETNIMRADNMRPGELRPVMITDQNTGLKQRHFIGPTSFVVEMGRPCRLVTRIVNPNTGTVYHQMRGMR
jgi:hypothetical protein